MSKRDFYETLGIGKNATQEEIKKAYRKLALEWHPDRNKTPQAAEKFKEINEAYEVLFNPEKKSAYDQFGHAAFEQGGFPGAGGPFRGTRTYQQGPFTYSYSTGGGDNPFEGGGFDFGGFTDPFEIFESFFGGTPFRAKRQPRNAVYSLIIDLRDAVKGAEKEIEVKGKKLKIKIPTGVDSGSRVRFGDFDLVFEVKQDKKFQRDGDDLYTSKSISFSQGALGDIIEVETFDGPVKLKVLPGTQPGTMVRLRGKGVTNIHTKSTGDLYIRLQIIVPTKLTHEQRELLKKLDESSPKHSGWF